MAAAETEVDGPAIRTLGALFSVSTVYLSDDARVSDLEVSDRIGSLEEEEEEEEGEESESRRSTITCDASISGKQETDYCYLMEDTELAQSMAALGLPVSFKTNKQRKVSTSAKRKGMLVKSKYAHNDVEEQDPGISKVEKVLRDGTILPVSINSTEWVASNLDDLEESPSSSVYFDAQFVCETAVTTSEVGESQDCDEIITLEQVVDEFQTSGGNVDVKILDHNKNLDTGSFTQDVSEELSSGHYLELPNKQESDNTSVCLEVGDWRVLWDDYYRRNYFYDSITQKTTWYAPPGFAYLASNQSTSNGLSADAAEQHSGFEIDCDTDRHQDANVIQVESDPLLENEIVIDQMLSDSSDKSNYVNCFGINCGSESFNTITNAKEVSEYLFSDHPTCINDNTRDELETLDKQAEKVTHDEASLEIPIQNCLITSSDEIGYDGEGNEGSMTDELGNNYVSLNGKKKRRARRQKSEPKSPGVYEGVSASTFKYWCQRYSLFTRYDSGIKLDEEGWFSVTPEPIARHHANRCGGGVVIDCFAGVGGNAIQFAIKSNYVIAIDIDPQKVELAYHNSTIYGVRDKIDFVQGDFFKMAAYLKGDSVFLSPPWGGPDYAKVQTYDIRSMLKPHDGYHLFKIASRIASKVVIYLPRNVDFNQLAELSLSVDPPWTLEVEKNILNGRLKAVTAYFTRTS
ncbi:unnamed protein product [Musa acuminata var. zebrina]